MVSTPRTELFKDIKRVVVKLGTRVVTVHQNELNHTAIQKLAEDVAELKSSGVQVAIVSSGAVGAGMGRLGLKARPSRIPELQATAAVGQGLLMNAYKQAFRDHGVAIGQVLLTADDLDDRQRYVNVRNTLEELFRLGAVPIVNENDSVAIEEIRVGDNDRLSALVAHLIDANLLAVFTNVDGLFSDDPNQNRDAEFFPVVDEVTSEMIERAGEGRSDLGLGGMRTKLQAAESVTLGGRMMVIANGLTTRIIDLLSGKEVGTLFLAGKGRMRSRKLWLASLNRKGSVVVDDGAVEAIWKRGKSLLPSGVLEVVGEFDAGELIGVEDPAHKEVARGLARYGSAEIRKILGKQTSEVASILAVGSGEEVIHRDDMVVSDTDV